MSVVTQQYMHIMIYYIVLKESVSEREITCCELTVTKSQYMHVCTKLK